MAKENKDNSVLSHIDQLVKEEERLYAKRSTWRPEAFVGVEGGARSVLGLVAAAPGIPRVWRES